MSYSLTEYFESSDISVQLSDSEAQPIIRARDQILTGLTTEYVYEIASSNFSELENALVPVRIESAEEFQELSWGDWIDILHVLSRKLSNYLSSVKTYQDRVPSLASKLSLLPARKGVVEALLSREYDSFLGYRFCCELRNFTQHAGLPLHYIRYEFHRVQVGLGQPELSYKPVPRTSLQKLAEGKFKPRVLRELANGGHLSNGERMFDVEPLVREYNESIRRVHGEVRQLAEPYFVEADRVINDAILKYSKLLGGTAPEALALIDSDAVDRPMFIGTLQTDHRKRLVASNALP